MFNGLPEESNNVEKSTNIETMQSMEDYEGEVPGKEKNPDVGSKTREGINYVNPIEGKNRKNNHVPARVVPTRVSDQAKRVLLAWTRRCRLATPGSNKPTEKITRKKREHVNSNDHVELFSKRLQIS